MKNIIVSLSLLFFLVASCIVSFNACTPEEDDPCATSAADNKFVNVGAIVNVLKGGVPVDSVQILVEITYYPCGVDEAEPTRTFTGYTNTLGVYETPSATNITLKNKTDRVKFYAVAPNIDGEIRNYAEVYVYYDDISTAGMATEELTILAKQN